MGMKPVAVAILATLLPTFLVIIILVCLLIYLYVNLQTLGADLRALRGDNEALQIQLHPPEPPQELAEWPTKVPGMLGPPGWKQEEFLSDASTPDWRHDMVTVICGMDAWFTNIVYRRNIPNEPSVDHKFGQILEALGYQGGASSAVLLKHLRNGATRLKAVGHITASIGLAKTSIDNDPESNVLPFSADIQRDLKTFCKEMKAMKLCPEFLSILIKIPSQIAFEHGEVNIEKTEKTIDLLDELFRPFGKQESFWIENSYRGRLFPPSVQESSSTAFINGVTLQMRILGSPEKFEFKWQDTNETFICTEPALYSYAGEDGVPLDEPRLWSRAMTYKIAENGSATFVGEPATSHYKRP